MNEHKKMVKGWGSKERKQNGRAAKGKLKAEGRKTAREQVQALEPEPWKPSVGEWVEFVVAGDRCVAQVQSIRGDYIEFQVALRCNDGTRMMWIRTVKIIRCQPAPEIDLEMAQYRHELRYAHGLDTDSDP